ADPPVRLYTIPAHTNRASSVAFGPDGRRLVTAGNDGTAKVWDLTAASPIDVGQLPGSPPAEGPENVHRAAWHPGGAQVAVGRTRRVQIWSLEGKAAVTASLPLTGDITALVYHPTGTSLATADNKGRVTVWN